VTETKHRVVIIGGGFGGLYAAQRLGNAPNVQVTLIDRRNFHLFQPLLYQVATGGLSPANIAAPLRSVLKRQRNTQVLMGEVVDIDLANRRVKLRDQAEVPYDYLIVAAGASHAYFGHPEWEKLAPGLKTIEDATEIRARVLSAFERAERTDDVQERQRLLTFVIVGGGPTGVELAGAVSELAHHTLRKDFRNIDPTTARVLLIEGQSRVLSTYHEKLSAKAKRSLEEMGVEVWLNTTVTAIEPYGVTIQREGKQEVIPTATVLWGAGVQASPLAKLLAQACGAETDRAGRIMVQEDLTLPGYPEVYVIGDMVHLKMPDGKLVPGVAPAAMQMGSYAATDILDKIAGRLRRGPFRYWDKGSMATIGRASAVMEAGPIRLSGLIAWLAWLFVHILFLIRFENRILVMWQWFVNYVTRGRSARLITGEHPEVAVLQAATKPSGFQA
jgi:NADH dehydrogenase